MASNQTEARIKADNALKNAQKSGITGKDLAVLQATYDAARAVELGKKGQNEQARSWF